jgi:hypothetical protein
MKRTGWLLITLVVLANAGCTRRDWVGDMLALTDVTGTWAATFNDRQSSVITEFSMVLVQNGTRVTGETSAPGYIPAVRSSFEGPLEGVVNGEVFTFTLGSGVRGQVHLDGEEMIGDLQGPQVSRMQSCPCPIRLRRSGPAAPGPSKTQ